MLISESPCTIHWARYLPQPAPAAMPIDAPLQCQKLRRPAAGPSSGLLSGVCGIAPHTTRLMPSSDQTGMRSITRSMNGVRLSKSASNSSFSESHSGQPPRCVQHSCEFTVS